MLAACELIRQKACDGLKARDVAAMFPCGRRMAEIRFRAALGHSILDEIRAVRRAKAQQAVTPFRTQLRDEVAVLCGYASWSSVHRLLSTLVPDFQTRGRVGQREALARARPYILEKYIREPPPTP